MGCHFTEGEDKEKIEETLANSNLKSLDRSKIKEMIDAREECQDNFFTYSWRNLS